MKSIKTTFLKGFRALVILGLASLLLGSFLIPSSQVRADDQVSGSIIASPDHITSGQSTQLSWNSFNATHISISPNVGSVSPSGSVTVSPTQTTTYTLTLSNDSGGSGSGTATVFVQGQNNPPTVSLTANPSSVQFNGSSTLTWSSNNATSCMASGGTNNWGGSVNTSGSFSTGNLANTTTYNITCSNSTGSANASATVSVGGQQQAPTVTLSANPSSVNYNGSSTLTWSSTNATFCTASGGTNGWGGNVSTSGNFNTGNLTGTTTYNINCSNSINSANAVATVFVTNNQQYCSDPNASNYGANAACTYFSICQDPSAINYHGVLPCRYQQYQNNFQLPTISISADRTNINYNEATTIRWYPQNATYCTGSGGTSGWSGTRSAFADSFYTGAIPFTTTYTLTCSNNYGSSTGSVTVAVGGPVSVAPVFTYTAPVVTSAVVYRTIANPIARSLVLLSSSVDRNQPIVPTLDNTHPRPGDEINYTVTYQNVGNASITNVTLQVNLPPEVDYLFSNPSNPSISGNTLVFNLGTLRGNSQGTVTVRVRVKDGTPLGTTLNFFSILSYVDPSGAPQSVSANVSAQVSDGSVAALGANVFGAGFFPDSIFSWLLLIILILLLVFLARYIMNSRAPAPAPTFAKRTTTTTVEH